MFFVPITSVFGKKKQNFRAANLKVPHKFQSALTLQRFCLFNVKEYEIAFILKKS